MRASSRSRGEPAPPKLVAAAFGRRAEWRATLLLLAKGYRVLDRNYSIRGGEIDLVVRRGNVVIFVEVKARPRLDEAMEALSAAKCRRVSKAARVWLARNPWANGFVLRGDGVFSAPWRLPRHVENAFELDV